jgi:hypothetical protein
MLWSGAASAATFQDSEDFHIAVEARRTTGQVLADFCIAGLDGMLSQALEVGIRWAANSLRIGKRLGKIRLCEPEEFFFVTRQ